MNVQRLALLPALAVLLSAALSATVQAKEWDHVRVATEGVFPPFNMATPDGKIVGFEPDLLEHVCAGLKLSCELVAQSWDGIIPGLLANKYDAIMAGMTINDERKKVVDFSIPYTQGDHAFVVLDDSGLTDLPLNGEHISLADPATAAQQIEPLKEALKGKTVGVQVSTIQLAVLNQFFEDDVSVRTYPTFNEAILDLKSGRVDAVLGSRTNMDSDVDKSNGQLVYSGPGFTGGPLGVGSGMAFRPADNDLRALFDRGLQQAIDDGTVKTLSEKWAHRDLTPQP